nr:HAMP domain-containing sensor histidine kinase [uncultured Gellertiella sp.]
MRFPASIRGRFLLMSALSVGLALALTSLLLVSLFSANIAKRIETELTGHLNTLAGVIGFDTDGNVARPKGLADQRFSQPYGGLYWQIGDEARGRTLRSASLWDFRLALPGGGHPDGTVDHYRLPGPEGASLIVEERTITVSAPEGPRLLRLAVAINARSLTEAREGFARDILPALAILALFLIGASIAQLAFGLKSLTSLSDGVDRIRERKDIRLSGPYPAEFESTVTAVNQLLETQAQMIDKARSRAADLAHGLRTPLTVLSNDALTLREKGETGLADELDHLAAVMRNHVERELTLSRISVSPELRRADTDLDTVIRAILRTLKRTPAGEALEFAIDGPQPMMVPVDPDDCRELVGNLLENAIKWASTVVTVHWAWTGGQVTLVITDDGPGVPEAEIDNLTRRGWRLDTEKPGTGLGLSIVREIAEVYALGFTVANRPDGGGPGLVVSLTF